MKVVCFSEIQWRYVRTRKQQILNRFPGDWEILFLSSVVRGKRNNFLPQREGRILHVCIPVFKNVPQRAIRLLFSFPPVRFLWNIVLFFWLQVVFLLTGFHGRDRVFYVSNIYYAAVLRCLGRSLLLYDCNDDPLAFPNVPPWAGGYFRGVTASADFVVAVSSGLAEKVKAAGARSVHLVGNGVDYEGFEAASRGTVPVEMARLARPVLGYVGAIAHWFDFELIDRIAAAYNGASLVLIGPVYQDLRSRLQEIVERRENVVALGTKRYEELGRYIASMDVCLIPLRVSELRRMADPNKLYEYASIGKPIVTMKYSDEIGALGDLVYCAGTQEEFIEKIGVALERGVDGERLKGYAKARSWQARADEMAALIVSFRREKGFTIR